MKPQAIYFKRPSWRSKELTFENRQACPPGRRGHFASGRFHHPGRGNLLCVKAMDFPLTVDYEERMYAGGRIPVSFFRREGKPSTDATLIARLIDRPAAARSSPKACATKCRSF